MTEYTNNKHFWSKVEQMISAGKYDEALTAFDGAIAKGGDAELFYQRGRLLWKLGRKTDAMSDYGRAVELDPDSQAAVALKMAREVMEFFNRDLYNP